MIKAVIFDCFGVLIGHGYTLYTDQLDRTDPDKAAEFRSIGRAADSGIVSAEAAVQYMSDLLDVEPAALLASQAKNEVRNQRLIDYIASLHGKYKTALLSNISGRDRLTVRFLPGQLDTLFSVVVASGEVGYIKPEPEIYQLVADQLGVTPAECLFIDDIAEFCAGAQAVGMQAIQFTTTDKTIADLNKLLT